MTTYRNRVGGEWVEAVGGETFETRDPATGEVLAGRLQRAQIDNQ